ncbi:MAG: AAA family ATPase [Gemmatimonadota bacterium]|nr:AAA family ATPase [Gemmatimonadota bacterium]
MANENRIRALREAVRVSPEDAALRGFLAQALAGAGHLGDAESELKEALRLEPGDGDLKRELASIFQRQDKHSAALVVIEDLLAGAPDDAALLLSHAKLLSAIGEVERARQAYRDAIKLDPSLADPSLARALGAGGVAASTNTGATQPMPPQREPPREPSYDPLGEREETRTGRPRISFENVGGMESVKEEIRLKIIHPLSHPELYRAYGKTAGGAILLYGPPGCGKTFLARATAGEIRASFQSVGINEVLDMWVGQSERNLHDLFQQARADAPSVLFFDEVDALAASRADLRGSAGRQLINQFLAELDGIDSANEGMLVMAATNAPWHLDDAFRRPGRFDRLLFIPPPDAIARVEILRLMLQDKPIDAIDYDRLAAKTDGYSGADLKGVVDVAIERKLQDALRTGRPMPISNGDLLEALAKTKPSTREWFATARNYVLYANQGGQYDAVRAYMDRAKS